jgi:hypothetical protein
MNRNLKTIILIAAYAAMLVCLLGGFDSPRYKLVLKNHVVSEGQTIWGIAIKYMPKQDEYRDVRKLVYDIRCANGKDGELMDCTLYPGQELIIPLHTKGE